MWSHEVMILVNQIGIKNVNRNKDNIAEIIEETADVEIMLAQLKLCYNIHKEVDAYKQEKLVELSRRIAKES